MTDLQALSPVAMGALAVLVALGWTASGASRRLAPGGVDGALPRLGRRAHRAPCVHGGRWPVTGMPTVATLPMWWQHGLPNEDGVFDDKTCASGAVNQTLAVIACAYLSPQAMLEAANVVGNVVRRRPVVVANQGQAALATV